jgi:hypothetical protein
MTSSHGSYRVGPVTCPIPECQRKISTLSNIIGHLTWVHPALSQRERALLKDEARRVAGWVPKEPKRTWDRGVRA